MSTTEARRVVAVSGVLYVMLSLIGFGDGSSKPSWVGADLGLLSLLCFLVFVATLSSVLGPTQGSGNPLSAMALAAGVLSVALKLSSYSFAAATNFMPGGIPDSHLADTLQYMAGAAQAFTWPTDALFIFAVAVLIFRSQVLPRWVGGGAAVVGLSLVASWAIWTLQAPFEFAPAVLFMMLWVVVTSITIVAYRGRVVESHRVGEALAQ
jgi:hypothetical protein